MSLLVVLAVVAVMTLIAATMAAVSTMSLNFTQRGYNASVAFSEAEAGISELIYNVADDAAFGRDGAREIRGRRAPDFDDRECWHAVTFRKGGDLPWSVNNLDGSNPQGYGGRAVPTNMVSVWSTGYCRGMVRTIEVLVEKPPFPYALATSGAIRSKTPLMVEGTRSAAEYQTGKKQRPGNICANSTLSDASAPNGAAIYVGADASHPDLTTYISGFAQSAGGIRIEQGVVVAGVRPKSSKVELPNIDIPAQRLLNHDSAHDDDESAGVIALGDKEWPLPKGESHFTLDAMYDRDGDLTLNGPVEMKNAYLFVNGSLTIRGSLTGVGAVVVAKDVTITGDASVSSAHRIALLSGGRITLNGSGNTFQGIVYARGGVTAHHLTVLGSVIVAGGPQADAVLDGVKVVSNRETMKIAFTANSSRAVSGKTTYTPGSWPLPTGGPDKGGGSLYLGVPPGTDPGGTPGWFGGDKPVSVEDVTHALTTNKDGTHRVTNMLLGELSSMPADANDIKSAAEVLSTVSTGYQDLQARIDTLNSQVKSLPETVEQTIVDSNGVSKTERVPNPVREAKNAEKQGLLDQQQVEKDRFDQLAKALAQALVDYYKSHVSQGLQFDTGGKQINVHREFTYDLDQFISDGARLKIVYWHVFGDRR